DDVALHIGGGMDLSSQVGLRRKNLLRGADFPQMRNGPEQSGGIATSRSVAGTTPSMRIGGMDLSSQVGLRLLVHRGLSLHELRGRNGPEQSGGIATFLPFSSP